MEPDSSTVLNLDNAISEMEPDGAATLPITERLYKLSSVTSEDCASSCGPSTCYTDNASTAQFTGSTAATETDDVETIDNYTAQRPSPDHTPGDSLRKIGAWTPDSVSRNFDSAHGAHNPITLAQSLPPSNHETALQYQPVLQLESPQPGYQLHSPTFCPTDYAAVINDAVKACVGYGRDSEEAVIVYRWDLRFGPPRFWVDWKGFQECTERVAECMMDSCMRWDFEMQETKCPLEATFWVTPARDQTDKYWARSFLPRPIHHVFEIYRKRTICVYNRTIRGQYRNQLPGVLDHEVGHVIGIRHDSAAEKEQYLPCCQITPGNSSSIMYDPPKCDYSSRTVQDEDVKVRRMLYSFDKSDTVLMHLRQHSDQTEVHVGRTAIGLNVKIIDVPVTGLGQLFPQLKKDEHGHPYVGVVDPLYN